MARGREFYLCIKETKVALNYIRETNRKELDRINKLYIIIIIYITMKMDHTVSISRTRLKWIQYALIEDYLIDSLGGFDAKLPNFNNERK